MASRGGASRFGWGGLGVSLWRGWSWLVTAGRLERGWGWVVAGERRVTGCRVGMGRKRASRWMPAGRHEVFGAGCMLKLVTLNLPLPWLRLAPSPFS